MTPKRAGRRVLQPLLGKARWQRAWEFLYELSLAGLNFGEGNHPVQSGERRVLELVGERTRHRQGTPVLFDVGANRGVYTRELLTVLPPPLRIYAFEPSATTFELLQANLCEQSSVELRNLGFSDEERVTTLYSPGEGSKLGSVYDTRSRLERIGMPLALEEEVRLTTIDRFRADEGIERIDLLKLDVEGHELKVLEGARDSLQRGTIDAIQFEFSAANIESRTFFKDFFELLHERYRLFRVLQDGLYSVDRYKEAHEVFKRATNYVALLRA